MLRSSTNLLFQLRTAFATRPTPARMLRLCPVVMQLNANNHHPRWNMIIRSYGGDTATSSSSSSFSSDAKVLVRGSIPAGGRNVAVGQFAETERLYTAEDVDLFARLVGDRNPLHRSWDVEKLPSVISKHPLIKKGKEPEKTLVLVHGMLVSSLFTCIFGTLIPGAVYLQQTLDFRKPVYVENSAVVGRVTITRIRRWRRKGLILTCDTTVFSKEDGEEKIRGQADVWLPPPSDVEESSNLLENQS